MNQTKYIKVLIHKTSLEYCKPTTTPCKPHNSLLVIEGTPLFDPSFYRSIVRSLQYLTFIRPNIAFAVNSIYHFMTSPTDVHLAAVKQILRYLQGTIQAGICYLATAAISLNAFSDTD